MWLNFTLIMTKLMKLQVNKNRGLFISTDKKNKENFFLIIFI